MVEEAYCVDGCMEAVTLGLSEPRPGSIDRRAVFVVGSDVRLLRMPNVGVTESGFLEDEDKNSRTGLMRYLLLEVLVLSTDISCSPDRLVRHQAEFK